jgi:hypothetical protein
MNRSSGHRFSKEEAMKGSTILCSFVLTTLVLATGTAGWTGTHSSMGVIREHFLQAQPTVREITRGLGQQPEAPEGMASIPGMKKPGRALIYSAFIPGTGELYVGAEKRGIAFLTVEATAWIWYFTQRSSGHSKEKDFKDFAGRPNANGNWIANKWSQEQYIEWYMDWENWYEDRMGDNDPDFEDIFTHHLPPQVDDDYYEMIGKYDQFSYGWIDPEAADQEFIPGDFAPNDSLLGYTFDITTYHICRWPEDQAGDSTATRNRDIYMDMRDEANKLLKRATWGISAALFNHVISAVDAALAAKSHNKALLQEARYPQLRMEMDQYAGEVIPKLTLTQKF